MKTQAHVMVVLASALLLWQPHVVKAEGSCSIKIVSKSDFGCIHQVPNLNYELTVDVKPIVNSEVNNNSYKYKWSKDGSAHIEISKESMYSATIGLKNDTPAGKHNATITYTGFLNGKPYCKCSVGVEFTVFTINFVTPGGDPVKRPNSRQGADGQNEFTFNNQAVGVLTMNLAALVVPPGTAATISAQCRFAVGTATGSNIQWDPRSPDGRPWVDGDRLLAIAQYQGLPPLNADFGLKTATVTYDNHMENKNDYEIFFMRNESNHPGGVTPNWFFYWNQVFPHAGITIDYDPAFAIAHAKVPAMYDWSYAVVPNKTLIVFGSQGPRAGQQYGVLKTFRGIDNHVASMVHEMKHNNQISRADPLVPTTGNDSFRYGWSWRQARHNHWSPGGDGKWGVPNKDDDKNNIVDDAVPVPDLKKDPPWELGISDQLLGHRKYIDWPAVWTLPNMVVSENPLESEAVNAANQTVTDNDYADVDWADPGKRHNSASWED